MGCSSQCAFESVAIVGGGKMGGAILEGWLSSDVEPAGSITAANVVVVDPGEQRRQLLSSRFGVTCVADVSDLTHADLVVLAVKPQIMAQVLGQITALDAFGGPAGCQDGTHAEKPLPLFVSIAAGITTQSLAQMLPQGAPVVRVMPNMPLQVGAGASAVCAGPNATQQHVQLVSGLFECLGRAVVVDEQDMDAVCALSGSGPAYVAAMIEALRDAAAEEGLDVKLAEELAVQTVLGTALLIDQSDLTPEQARIAICSPGGTTLAALEAMDHAGFAEVFSAGVKAAIQRSRELAASS